jgi:hypothetical protein
LCPLKIKNVGAGLLAKAVSQPPGICPVATLLP